LSHTKRDNEIAMTFMPEDWDGGTMTPRVMRRTVFGSFLIFGATAAVLGFLGGFGIIKDIAILSIVGGGVSYATMRLID
jgi:hypothetical protein